MTKDNSLAKVLASRIKKGWNLGNYFDATDYEFEIGESMHRSFDETVGLWGNGGFDERVFDRLLSLGFNAVRIPITFCNFLKQKTKKIVFCEEFIEKLEKIVAHLEKLNFIVILDMHHDDKIWLNVGASEKEFQKIRKFYKKLWAVFAKTFASFSENVIFEGMNEIVDRSGEKADWWGRNSLCYSRLSRLYVDFFKAVRKRGKQNKRRALMISTYGAQIHEKALRKFCGVKDKNVIMDLHFYAEDHEKEYFDKWILPAKEKFCSKNIPFVFGEVGVNKKKIENSEILDSFCSYLENQNIKYFLWDNGKERKFVDRKI